MSNALDNLTTRARQRHARLLLTLATMALVLTNTGQFRRAWARARDDRGSESVEKAVLVAIGLGAAVGLAFVIRAVVQKYQAQIQ